MRKHWLSLLILAFAAVTVGVCACSDKKGDMEYGMKYIAVSDIAKSEDKQSYLIFEKDYITCHIYYYYSYSSEYSPNYSYTLEYSYDAKYKYEILSGGNTAIAFFNSVSNIEGEVTGNTSQKIPTEEEIKEEMKGRGIPLTISKNYVVVSYLTTFINAAYINNMPASEYVGLFG